MMAGTELKWDTYVLENAITRLHQLHEDNALECASQEFIGKLPRISSGPCAETANAYEKHISSASAALYGMAKAMEKWLQEQLDAVRGMDQEQTATIGSSCKQDQVGG